MMSYGGEVMTDKKATETIAKKEYIQKKDLFYIIVFLVFALVLLFSWRAGDISVLVNQISLVGSVSSILLALIAIGYAFFQANNSSWENRQMLDTLGRVNEKVEELGNIKDEMLIIKDELSNFKETSNDGMSNMMEAISDLPTKLNFEGFSELLKEQGVTIPNEVEENIKVKYQEKLNDEMNRLKSNVTRLDSKLETEIANYIGFQMRPNELMDRGNLRKYLAQQGIKAGSQDISIVLRKFSRFGLLRAEKGLNIEGGNLVDYFKSGDFEVVV